MIKEILRFVRETKARTPKTSEYADGYLDALREVEECILDVMWENGEDDDEEAS